MVVDHLVKDGDTWRKKTERDGKDNGGSCHTQVMIFSTSDGAPLRVKEGPHEEKSVQDFPCWCDYVKDYLVNILE